MYACLHVPAVASQATTLTAELQQLALQFSPLVETTSANTVMFCITPLRRLIGSPHQIASEICRYGYERNLRANLAIASNPDAAALLACHYTGVTLVTPGEERFQIAPIPLDKLFSHDLPVDPSLLNVLRRWGLKTCEDLAALPEKGITERLGAAGVYLRNLATGRINRPLRVPAEEISYEKRLEPEYPIILLEPLLFLFGSVLTELCGRLRSQSRSARLLQVKLELSQPSQSEESASSASVSRISSTYECALEFPVPVDQGSVMLKLLQLHLERHPPAGAITAFTLRLDPVEPQRLQGGLFLPATPQPAKLHVTLKRIEGMVGGRECRRSRTAQYPPSGCLSNVHAIRRSKSEQEWQFGAAISVHTAARAAALPSGAARSSATGRPGPQAGGCARRAGSGGRIGRPLENLRRLVDSHSLGPRGVGCRSGRWCSLPYLL